MTILLIIKRFDFGGAECHVTELANQLAEQGHKVILLGGTGRQTNKLSKKVVYKRVLLRDYLIPYNLFQLISIIKKFNVDVIHAHQRLPILISSVAGYLTNKKVIATVHGRTKYDLKHYLSRKIPEKIIFVNKKILEISEKRYKLGYKSVYIPNGIKINDVMCEPEPYRLCYVSKINKAHLSFLKLMILKVMPAIIQKYPEIEFVIFGDGKNKNKLYDYVRQANLPAKNLHIDGYTSSTINAAKNASLIMGVGRVAIEAASVGAPVLSVNGKRLTGIVNTKKYEKIKNTNFICSDAPPPNEQSLVELIEEFFSKKEIWEAEAKEISEYIKKDFALEKIIQETSSLYKEVIHEG